MGLILDARSSAFWVLRVDSCSCLCSVKRARLVHTCSGDDERLIESSTEIVASYPFIGIEDRALMLHYPTTVSDEHYIISAYISRNTNDIRETFALILLNFVHSDRLCPELARVIRCHNFINRSSSVVLALLPDFSRNLDRRSSRLHEQMVDPLQSQIGSLWVAEVDQRHECQISTHEDQVCLPLELVNNHRRDHNNDKVPQPITADSDGCAFRSGLEGENLRNIAPGDAIDRSTEDLHMRLISR